eukprot:10371043-Lingulodinium_polyedra.AAC.1
MHTHQLLACAWSARACDSRTAAATDGRFDRIVPQRIQNVAERCGRIGRPLPQLLAHRTLTHVHAYARFRARA